MAGQVGLDLKTCNDGARVDKDAALCQCPRSLGHSNAVGLVDCHTAPGGGALKVGVVGFMID